MEETVPAKELEEQKTPIERKTPSPEPEPMAEENIEPTPPQPSASNNVVDEPENEFDLEPANPVEDDSLELSETSLPDAL